MQIYVHTENNALELTEVDPSAKVGALLSHGPEEADHIWLEDSDEPLEQAATLEDAGISDRCHIHVSRCRKIEVRIRFGGDDKNHKFAPSATVGRVFKWATGKKGFELTPSERAKHTLGICDTLTQPDKAEHIGSIAGHDCSVCLDLAPKERFEG